MRHATVPPPVWPSTPPTSPWGPRSWRSWCTGSVSAGSTAPSPLITVSSTSQVESKSRAWTTLSVSMFQPNRQQKPRESIIYDSPSHTLSLSQIRSLWLSTSPRRPRSTSLTMFSFVARTWSSKSSSMIPAATSKPLPPSTTSGTSEMATSWWHTAMWPHTLTAGWGAWVWCWWWRQRSPLSVRQRLSPRLRGAPRPRLPQVLRHGDVVMWNDLVHAGVLSDCSLSTVTRRRQILASERFFFWFLKDTAGEGEARGVQLVTICNFTAR